MQKPRYVMCPYCGYPTSFMASEQYYGRDYGANIYVCHPCDARVGTHKRSNVPLGTPANAELRRWRSAAHQKFDPLWRGKKRSRTEAYRWMQKAMGLTEQQAHIGRFNISQCQQLIQLVDERNQIAMQQRLNAERSKKVDNENRQHDQQTKTV
jgi:zinc-finger-containing domain